MKDGLRKAKIGREHFGSLQTRQKGSGNKFTSEGECSLICHNTPYEFS